MEPLPPPIRAAAGLIARSLDEARTLPSRLLSLPVVAAGTAMQVSLRVQQEYAALIARGDEVLLQLRSEDEQTPAWATFDEDGSEPTPDPGGPPAEPGDGSPVPDPAAPAPAAPEAATPRTATRKTANPRTATPRRRSTPPVSSFDLAEAEPPTGTPPIPTPPVGSGAGPDPVAARPVAAAEEAAEAAGGSLFGPPELEP